MGEKSQKPSAEETKESQNIDNLDKGESTLNEEKTTEAVDNQKIQDKTQESTNEIETKQEEDRVKKTTPLPDKASEIDYSKFNIQELIEAFSRISSGDQWLRNQTQI